MSEGFEKFVPKYKTRKKQKPIWMNQKSLRKVKKKYCLYKKYLTTNSHYDYQNYIAMRNEAKRELRRSVKDYEKKISKESKKNVKGFWRYVNTKLKRSTGICNLLGKDDK